MFTYRELTPEEYPLAPREVLGSKVFTPENSKIVAAFDEKGEIISTFTLFYAAHLEPMWIRPDHRNSPTILRRMDQAMKKTLRSIGAVNAYTVVLNSTPVLARFARFFGAKPVDGTLYFWKE
jgi:hypothetical protein